MLNWWKQIKRLKWLILLFAFFLLIAIVGYVLLRLNIVHQSIMDFQTPLFWGVVAITFMLFGILWVFSAPYTHRLLLLLGLSVTTLGLYTAMLAPLRSFVLVGMALIVVSGIPALRKYKWTFLIAFPLYYIIGCIFFGYFETGAFMIHALGFGLAILGLYLPNKKVNYALASGALVIPSFAFLLLSALYGFDLAGSEPAIRGELSSPFEEHLMYEQKIVPNFIDTNYELRIYLPMSLGFYQEIGVYSSEAYFPELTPTDFEWETIDEDSYRLHFYEYEGEMQYTLTIEL